MSVTAKIAPDGVAIALAQPRPVESLPIPVGASSSRAFHASIPGYRPTPLRAAPGAARRLGVGEVLVKHESERLGLVAARIAAIEGYGTIFTEIDEALERERRGQPDVVVVPIGVGALAAAVVRHYWALPAKRPRLVGVEPTSAACVLQSVAAGRIVTLAHPQTSIMAGLNCATPSLIAWPLVLSGIDVYLAVPDAFIADATRLLAADGIVAGECGAAGLAAMTAVVGEAQMADAREVLDLGPDSTVLLICTEGATDPVAYRRLTGAEH